MSSSGIIDLVPRSLRERWSSEGDYPDEPVYALFAKLARDNPDRLAVLSYEKNITYGELRDKAMRLARGLKRAGIVPGDVVAYQLSNHWLCCAIDLAVAALGGIVAPFPPGRGKLDIQSLLRRCKDSHRS